MTPNLLQSIASLVVSVMSFLGWNTNEYVFLLPPQIKNQIIIEDSISTIEALEDDEEKGRTEKVSELKPIIKPEVSSIVKTNTQTQKKEPEKTIKTTTSNIKPATTPSTKPTKTNPPKIIVPSTKVTVTPPVIKTEPSTPTTTPKKVPDVEKKEKTPEEKIKSSVVNIYCSRVIGNKIQKTTGSGVIISSDGVIVTNAHVAEYFLLAQGGHNTTCYIRTGSPASNSYKAKLIYLPSIWIDRNKNNLSMSTLTGTGEYDYALLVITERISKTAKNIPLDYLEVSGEKMDDGQSIILSGYPAGFSDVKILDSALYSLVKYSEVARVSGFDGRSPDVINTSPTVLAEHGSSGGAVTNKDGKLQALIAATNIDSYSGKKNIQAVTFAYIKKNIKDTTGKSFEYYLENAHKESETFENNSVQMLSKILLNN